MDDGLRPPCGRLRDSPWTARSRRPPPAPHLAHTSPTVAPWGRCGGLWEGLNNQGGNDRAERRNPRPCAVPTGTRSSRHVLSQLGQGRAGDTLASQLDPFTLAIVRIASELTTRCQNS
jgi:hypothetical protein